MSLRVMARNRVGFAGFIVTMLIISTAFIAPHFVPLDRVTKVQKSTCRHPLRTLSAQTTRGATTCPSCLTVGARLSG
jgi:hypothetical protein